MTPLDLSRREFLALAAAPGAAGIQSHRPPPSGSEFDVIIVGGGTIGLAAAYYAARARKRTLLVEQFEFWNPYASSGGYSRLFRVMHSDVAAVRLAQEARQLWRQVEAASGERLLETRPLLFYGTPKAEPNAEGNFVAMAGVLTKLGIHFKEFKTAAALRKEYGVFAALPADYRGLMQPDSAVIRVRESMLVFQRLAARAGAVLLERQKSEVKPANGRYEVSCDAGTYRTPSVILCPGPWANEVLRPFNLRCDLTIWQMTVPYFRADTRRYRYPIWYEFGPIAEDFFYGFPPEHFDGYVKVSVDHTNAFFATPAECTYRPDSATLRRLQDFVGSRFKGVDTTPAAVSTCLYTMSDDYQMILGAIPGFPRAAMFIGDSGRGFKFTPLFGQILAELALGMTPTSDICTLSPLRLIEGKPICHPIPASPEPPRLLDPRLQLRRPASAL